MLLEKLKKGQLVKNASSRQYSLIVKKDDKEANRSSKIIQLISLFYGNALNYASQKLYLPTYDEEKFVRKYHSSQIDAIHKGNKEFPNPTYLGWDKVKVVDNINKNKSINLNIRVVCDFKFDSDLFEEDGEENIKDKLYIQAKERAIIDLQCLAIMLGINTITKPIEKNPWSPKFEIVGGDIYRMYFGAIYNAKGLKSI